MGLDFVVWSWLALANPTQQKDLSVQPSFEQKSKTEQTTETSNKQEEKKADKSGVASFYHNKFEGRKTATGEIFDNGKYTAASNHFKLGTYVKVTNQSNGKVVYVKVNDRMGHKGRVIDLAEVAAQDLKFIKRGITNVKIETVSSEEGKRQITAQKKDASASDVKEAKNKL